jgi:Lecithin retinol acyltransferase
MARGDHIYVEDCLRGIPFQHHGIDMGDGTAIHLAPLDGARVTLRDSSERFIVHRVSIEQFAASRTIKVRKHADHLTADEVVAKAESLLGKTGYCLVEDNCEHFATLCTTGRSASHQIQMSEAAVATLTSAATKGFWSFASRFGFQAIVKSSTKIHPAALLADGVEMATLAVGCHRGMNAEEARRVAKISGNVAAVGIGALVGGPVGAAVGLAAHASSRAIGERASSVVRRVLGGGPGDNRDSARIG